MLDKIKIYRNVHDLTWREVAAEIGIGEKYLKILAGGQYTAGPKAGHKIRKYYWDHREEIDAAVEEWEKLNSLATERVTA